MSLAADIAWTSVHATVAVYLDQGVLVRGPAGSGKSSLALALLIRAQDIGAFGALVGDDRVRVAGLAGRLLARGVESATGLIERRAAGLVAAPFEPATVVRLVVDMAERGRSWPRMPAEAEESAVICGVRLPRLALDSTQGPADHALAAHERLVAMLANKATPQANFA
jgi:serine kinase of HPr protein (carbohydrate metabolism regulator)